MSKKRDFDISFINQKPALTRRENCWDIHYAALLAYKEKFGNYNVPKNWQKNPQLAVWVDAQRQLYRKHSLPTKRIQKLNHISFNWKLSESKWQKYYSDLIAYRDQHGHCDVPYNWQENPQLRNWVLVQRRQYHDHLLSAERIQKLSHIGFNWKLSESKWQKYYSDLIAYRNEHGHCDIPKNRQENPQLEHWVAAQRTCYHKGLLSAERIQKLNTINFSWGIHKDQWEKKYYALIAYRAEHGHCDIPKNQQENSQLERWIAAQRTCYHKGLLSAERIQKLNTIGFNWKPDRKSYRRLNESKWEKHYSALMTYKNEHGDCNVPQSWQENPQLERWVKKQRELYCKHLLPTERIQRLNLIDFSWKPHKDQWEKHYSDLMVYKDQYGHCNVPHHWQKDLQLGHWVNGQRQLYRKHLLSTERIQKLNNINFLWEPKHK